MPSQLFTHFYQASITPDSDLAALQQGIPPSLLVNEVNEAGLDVACCLLEEHQLDALKRLMAAFEVTYFDRVIQLAWQKSAFEFLQWLITQKEPLVTRVITIACQDLSHAALLAAMSCSNPVLQALVQNHLTVVFSPDDQLIIDDFSAFHKRYALPIQHTYHCYISRDQLLQLNEKMGEQFLAHLTELETNPSLKIFCQHPIFKYELMTEAAERGDIAKLQFLHQQGFPLSLEGQPRTFLEMSILSRNTNLIEWLLATDLSLIENLRITTIEQASPNIRIILEKAQLQQLKNTLARPEKATNSNNKRANDDDDDDNDAVKRLAHPSRKIALQSQRKRSEVIRDITLNYQVDPKYLGMPPLPSSAIMVDSATNNIYHNWPSFTVAKLKRPNKVNSFKVFPIEQAQFNFDYVTTAENLPSAQERVTLVFAKRGLQGYYPNETAGGRVILMLAIEEAYNPTGQAKAKLKKLLADFRDVCVIRSLQGISEHQVGLIMSRRLAGFYLMHHLNRDHYMLLDDNVKSYLFNPQYAANQVITWQWIYQHFANEAAKQSLDLVSARSMNPVYISKTGSELLRETQEKLGSKVFYINGQSLRQQFNTFEKISTLLTRHVDLWGSDLFFQLAIMLTGKVGVMHFQSMIIDRADDNKNAACKTVRPAPIWLERSVNDFLPGMQQMICTIIQSIVQNSLDYYHQQSAPLRKLDLLTLHAEKNKLANELRVALPPASNELPESMIVNNPFLRPYQIQMVQAMLRQSQPTGIIKAPPRVGKTAAMIYFLLLMMRAMTGKYVLITPQMQLADQLYQDIIRFNQVSQQKMNLFHVVKVQSSVDAIDNVLVGLNDALKNATVLYIFCAASFKLLVESFPDFMTNVVRVIIDEVHKVSHTIQTICVEHAVKNNKKAICVSATPGRRATANYRHLLFDMSLREAYQQNIIAKCVVDSIGASFSPDKVQQFIACLPHFLNEFYHPSGKKYREVKTLIFVKGQRGGIDLANQTCELLKSQNISAVTLHSKVIYRSQTLKSKEAIIDYFCDENSGCNVLIVVDMCKFGTTLKNCSSVIYLQNSQSSGTKDAGDDLLQAVSRCTQQIDFQNTPATQRVAHVLCFDDANLRELDCYMTEDAREGLAPAYLNQNCKIEPFTIKPAQRTAEANESPEDSDADVSEDEEQEAETLGI